MTLTIPAWVLWAALGIPAVVLMGLGLLFIVMWIEFFRSPFRW